MRTLLPFLVIGIANGSIYALAGLGLVLTYKTSGIFNFAHGAQAAAGAYVFYEFWQRQGWPWPLAAVASLALVGVVGGLLLERLAHALDTASTWDRIVATVGLLVGIQGLIVAHYGATTIRLAQFLPDRTLHLPGVNVRVDQIIVTVLALTSAAALYLFFRRARAGVAMQGVVEDAALLGLLGTSPVATRRRAWMLGSIFATVSGILLAPTLGLDATLLTLLVVQAFGAAAIGWFDSLAWTYAGGLVVGVGAALSTRYLAHHRVLTQLPTTLPFIVLFVALLVVPRRRLVERGVRRVRRASPPATLAGPARVATLAAGGVALLLVPQLVGTKLPVYTTGLVFVLLFASLSLLVHTSGQVSLCHMGFAAVGAAAFAHAQFAGFPWPLAVLAGGLLAIPVGAVVAVPAIRLPGIFLAVATFGFGILLERMAFTSFLMFRVLDQLQVERPHLGGLHVDTDTGYYYVVLAVVVAGLALAGTVRHSRLGRLLRAMADSPAALNAHGVNTNLTRLLVFCLSAFLAGVAGALSGPVTGSISGLSFNFQISLLLLAVLAIAGRRPVLALVVAAAGYVVVPAYITSRTFTDYLPVLFGVFAILSVAPVGAVGGLRSRRAEERVGRSRVSLRAETT